jgi:hypothetical protein
MGLIEQAVRAKLTPGQLQYTASRHAPFRISVLDDDGLVVDLALTHATRISWACMEGIVPFLRGRGWVRCAGRHSVQAEPGSLDAYLKQHGPPRDVTNWVATILDAAEVAELDIGPPLRIRLAPLSQARHPGP